MRGARRALFFKKKDFDVTAERMCVGIPAEVKPGEYRVAGLPDHVRRLRAMGCRVVVQAGAGANAGAPDREYQEAGAEILADAGAVHAAADLLWKVKEVMPSEFAMLRAGQTVFTYLHAPPRPRMTEVLRQSGCIAIAYEEMTDENGRRPLLAPMSRLAGAGAVALAAQFSQALYGGSGKLLFLTDGAAPAGVLILGGGVAGRAAARAALGAGAKVRVLEPVAEVRARLETELAGAEILDAGEAMVRRLLPETDILLNCTLWMPGDPRLVTRGMLGLMRPRSLIMDVAADPNGGIETSVETTHDNPIRIIDGILHYCVQNIPALFPKTASRALSEVTWPFLEAMVLHGVEQAVRSQGMLRRGVVAWRGSLVGADLGRIQNIPTMAPDDILRLSPRT